MVKRALVAIIAVAIIGALGAYGNKHSTTVSANTPNSAASSNSSGLSDNSSNNGSSGSSSKATYKDGTYNGATEDTPYGPVQIAVVVSGGKISDINFLQMPADEGHSQEVTAFSEPLLKQETIQKQTTKIDFVSGATSTSEAYRSSLQAALDQAA
jgi:uncharacterized protein with FMN-binding domain